MTGARYVAVSLPGSDHTYHGFRNPYPIKNIGLMQDARKVTGQQHRCPPSHTQLPDISTQIIHAILTVYGQRHPYTPIQTLPMLAVAYELYVDATRDAEILLRNDIKHPSFVPPLPLSILSS